MRYTKEDKEKLHKSGEVDANYESRWDYVLDEMIWAFDFILREEEILPMPETSLAREWWRPNYAGTEQERINDKENWEKYMQEYRKLNARKIAGLKLFAEHFEGLWD
jgi:hypothetical protein